VLSAIYRQIKVKSFIFRSKSNFSVQQQVTFNQIDSILPQKKNNNKL
jgi:hypothetical protein